MDRPLARAAGAALMTVILEEVDFEVKRHWLGEVDRVAERISALVNLPPTRSYANQRLP